MMTARTDDCVLNDCRCPYYDLTPGAGSPRSYLSGVAAGSNDTEYFGSLNTSTQTCGVTVSAAILFVSMQALSAMGTSATVLR